jgi:hypothetical protein
LRHEIHVDVAEIEQDQHPGLETLVQAEFFEEAAELGRTRLAVGRDRDFVRRLVELDSPVHAFPSSGEKEVRKPVGSGWPAASGRAGESARVTVARPDTPAVTEERDAINAAGSRMPFPERSAGWRGYGRGRGSGMLEPVDRLVGADGPNRAGELSTVSAGTGRPASLTPSLRRLDVEDNCDRAVVDEFHLHPRAKNTRLDEDAEVAECRAEAPVARLRVRRRRGGGKAGTGAGDWTVEPDDVLRAVDLAARWISARLRTAALA